MYNYNKCKRIFIDRNTRESFENGKIAQSNAGRILHFSVTGADGNLFGARFGVRPEKGHLSLQVMHETNPNIYNL